MLYYPHTPDIPLISHKKDARIDAGITSIASANMTFSYGLTNHIALQAYGDARDKISYQGAVGYYTHFGENNIIEIYGGAGNFYGKAYNDANPGKLYGHYQVYFTQFNIGTIDFPDGWEDFGFGIRTGYLNADLTDQNYFYSGSDSPINFSDNGIIIEPMVFARIGSKRLKINVKLAGCKFFDLSEIHHEIPYARFIAGLGLNYRIIK